VIDGAVGTAGVLAIGIAAIVGGFAVTVVASRRAVSDAAVLAAGTRLPPFLVGITLLAIGTDLPEIANSIVASVTGHGDINVGDSVGSAATQMTLVLGLLPILGGGIRCRTEAGRPHRGSDRGGVAVWCVVDDRWSPESGRRNSPHRGVAGGECAGLAAAPSCVGAVSACRRGVEAGQGRIGSDCPGGCGWGGRWQPCGA
jgi:hypothetical protein